LEQEDTQKYYDKGLIESRIFRWEPERFLTIRNNSKSADAAIGAFFIDRENYAEKYGLPLVFNDSKTRTIVKT
jgi:hypothetical protein